jgi:hypothetical protein
MLNIYHVKSSRPFEYDTYDEVVVLAPDADTASRMHPRNGRLFESERRDCWTGWEDWDAPGNMMARGLVRYLGVCGDSGETQRVVCASFNAG